MIVVSVTDTDYLRKIFPDKKVEYMPSFHINDQISVKPDRQTSFYIMENCL